MTWVPSVKPGESIAVFTGDETKTLDARRSGLELRDTILVVGPASVRFVFLFRCPPQGEISGLNIDACRVPADLREFYSATGKPRSGMGHARGFGMGDGYGGDRANPPHPAGRWPTNLVFIHGTCTPDSCEERCPVRLLDAQSGIRPSTLTGRADPSKRHANPGDNHGASTFGGGNSNVYADSGGASRFFPQFASDDDFIVWLQNLIGHGEIVSP